MRLSEVEDDGDPLFFTARVERHEGGENWSDCGVHRIYRRHFEFTANSMSRKKIQEQRNLDDNAIDELGLIQCDWAFCTTAHKAQGSEFDKAVVVTENWPPDGEDRRRWLYTAVTRARSELRIIDLWNVRRSLGRRTGLAACQRPSAPPRAGSCGGGRSVAAPS